MLLCDFDLITRAILHDEPSAFSSAKIDNLKIAFDLTGQAFEFEVSQELRMIPVRLEIGMVAFDNIDEVILQTR
jgi:hypothetical protein